jgi:hypothetical protein
MVLRVAVGVILNRMDDRIIAEFDVSWLPGK